MWHDKRERENDREDYTDLDVDEEEEARVAVKAHQKREKARHNTKRKKLANEVPALQHEQDAVEDIDDG
jgi:hypothetical protein